jgi:hypothetical protein
MSIMILGANNLWKDTRLLRVKILIANEEYWMPVIGTEQSSLEQNSIHEITTGKFIH